MHDLHRIPMTRRRLAYLALCLWPALGCPPPGDDNGPPMPPEPSPMPTADLDVNEAEPNDNASTAQSARLAEANTVRLRGSIDTPGDIDVYELGSLTAGDRIRVYVSTPETQFETATVVFDTDADKLIGTVFAANASTPESADAFDLHIDDVIRHDSDHGFLAVAAAFSNVAPTGAYDLIVSLERGGAAPQPQRQTLMLDFDGGTTTTSAGQTVTVASFDATAIDAAYAGQTQVISSAIVATVEENFAGYHVDVLNTDEDAPPSDQPFSTVFIGQVSDGAAIAGGEGLGAALGGTDAYNKDPADDAVVFIENFGPANFNLSAPLTPEQLGVAIGNVATHEAGHLMGLHHAFDPASIMNTFDSPQTLLLDQRFKRSLIHFSIFDPMSNFLTQDAHLMLAETVGCTERVADATYAVGDTPFAVVAGDWDGDGDTDLAVANRFSDSVSVLLNNGDATFASAVHVDIGAGPLSLVALDADGDGDIDLVTANPAAQNLTLLANDGQGGFSLAATLTAGDRPASLAAGDFDGDGDQDLAAANFGGNDVSILLNDGNGNFQSAATHAAGEAPGGVTVADLNGDGALDLAVTNFQSDNVSILLNNGDGTFADAVQTSGGRLPGAAAAADLDGDLNVPQDTGDVSILLNRGDGTFAQNVVYRAGNTPTWIAAANLDSDTISVFLNTGDGSFGLPE